MSNPSTLKDRWSLRNTNDRLTKRQTDKQTEGRADGQTYEQMDGKPTGCLASKTDRQKGAKATDTKEGRIDKQRAKFGPSGRGQLMTIHFLLHHLHHLNESQLIGRVIHKLHYDWSRQSLGSNTAINVCLFVRVVGWYPLL